MNTNTMELNLNEMEMITGGDAGDHFAGAVMGMGLGAITGGLTGGLVGGLPGIGTGAIIGAPIGAVAGGIVGIRKLCDGADSAMRKFLSLF